MKKYLEQQAPDKGFVTFLGSVRLASDMSCEFDSRYQSDKSLLTSCCNYKWLYRAGYRSC